MTFWLLIFGTVVAYFLIRRLILEQLYLRSENKNVMITGCDSGFGKLTALKLLKQNVNVFAGCYTEKGSEDLVKEWKKLATKSTLHTVRIDISSEESVSAAKQQVKRTLDEKGELLHGLVNNAGIFTTFGPLDWCTTSDYFQALNVNALGTIRVCQQFLPLIKQSKGRIVTMGSTAGRLHGRYVGPYVTAKFAVEAYMDCLRLEMRPFGVSVHLLEPGAFKTELLDTNFHQKRIDKMWEKLPEEVKEEYGEQFQQNFKDSWQRGLDTVANPNLYWVVDTYIHALFAWYPRLRYSPGWDAILLFIPISVLPTYLQDNILSLLYSLQPGPQLVPKVLQNRKQPTTLKSLMFTVGQASLIMISLIYLWARSGLERVITKINAPANVSSS